MKKPKKWPEELNLVWYECLRMWSWIVWKLARMIPKPTIPTLPAIIGDLKDQWMKKSGYTSQFPNCFFCRYANLPSGVKDCSSCPGRLVDPAFGCADFNYHYGVHPKKFYEKLVELDKIRQSKKGSK